ncbi:hypothetical protein yc1106_01366 [Curvularia clavata]|uniref:Uncharacterized protein n=1 Tax=Curvularia clavata TaxID=95742 RepID=A0A9Q9DP24_CURCL|nr:hypothetical protein yc1106_01366 [Curvularia clavata]
MANTELIAAIIVAIISLIGSFLTALLSWYSQRKSNNELETLKNQIARAETVYTLTEKYGQLLVVAAYDLQQRLFELVEYPISRQHLEKREGLEDLKIFTCFLLARYLVAVHIIRTKTAYLSFSTEPELKELRTLMYVIDEELDRRRTRDRASQNIGVWPAARILIGERMVSDKDEANNALDGGFGFKIKGFDQFRKDWDKDFKEPMGYFCETIDMNIEGRMRHVDWSECALRVLQHLLVDLVKRLDTKQAYVTADPRDMKCQKSERGCDCDSKDCGNSRGINLTLKERQNTRWGDPGMRTRLGLESAMGRHIKHPSPDMIYTLEGVQKSTYYIDLD